MGLDGRGCVGMVGLHWGGCVGRLGGAGLAGAGLSLPRHFFTFAKLLSLRHGRRAGSMLIAYLMAEKDLSPALAQQELLRIRPHVSPRLWARPSVRELHRRRQISRLQHE